MELGRWVDAAELRRPGLYRTGGQAYSAKTAKTGSVGYVYLMTSVTGFALRRVGLDEALPLAFIYLLGILRSMSHF